LSSGGTDKTWPLWGVLVETEGQQAFYQTDSGAVEDSLRVNNDPEDDSSSDSDTSLATADPDSSIDRSMGPGNGRGDSSLLASEPCDQEPFVMGKYNTFIYN
jgi:hypothetical protein